jgi:ferredoxin
MKKDIPVTLLPSGLIKNVSAKKDLFSQLKEAGVHLNSNCGGCATCALCVVKVVANENSMNEVSFEEKQLLGNVFHITRERLACQLQITGPITLDISDHEQKDKPAHKPLRRSREEAQAVVDERKKMTKEKNENKPKKLGGGKKPSAFKFDNDEKKE